MKSEQEFLAAMWSEIDAKEWEAEQKLIAHKLNRQLFLKEIFTYGMIAALIVIGSVVTLLLDDNPGIVYIVAVLLLSAAFYSERVIDTKSQGVQTSEN